jgi:hypothetical protein
MQVSPEVPIHPRPHGSSTIRNEYNHIDLFPPALATAISAQSIRLALHVSTTVGAKPREILIAAPRNSGFMGFYREMIFR